MPESAIFGQWIRTIYRLETWNIPLERACKSASSLWHSEFFHQVPVRNANLKASFHFLIPQALVIALLNCPPFALRYVLQWPPAYVRIRKYLYLIKYYLTSSGEISANWYKLFGKPAAWRNQQEISFLPLSVPNQNSPEETGAELWPKRRGVRAGIVVLGLAPDWQL